MRRQTSPSRASPLKSTASPSKRYYDQSLADSDHKDLVISQLKAELFDLRQNSRDYDDLHQRLSNLEHRYNLLQEERLLNEADFKNRYETNLKTIANLKNEIDMLKRDYNDISSTNASLRVENKNINDIIDSRTAEIARLNNQLDDLDDHNGRLDLDKKDLSVNVRALKDDNIDLSRRVSDLNKTVDELTLRRIRFEKLLKELENDVARLDRTQNSLNKEQDQLRIEIYNKNDNIRFAENTLQENKKTIVHLEGDVSELKRVNERTRNEILQHTKNQQGEFGKNVEASNKQAVLEQVIDDRDNEVGDLKAAIEALRQKHAALLKLNEDTNHDTELATKHLEELTIHNHELVHELDQYHRQDEEVRSKLNRKEKVQNIKEDSNEKMKQSFHRMNSSLKSPSRLQRNDTSNY